MTNYYNKEEIDFDILLNDYTNYCFEELTYYGSLEIEKISKWIVLGQKLNLMEENIINNHYNKCVKLVKKDINNPNIYILHKIFFTLINLIIKMIKLINSNIKEFNYKLEYIIGMLENYVDRIIVPIQFDLKNIIDSNKVFKLENSILDLKLFIEMNKSIFTSNKKIDILNNLFSLLE